MASLELRSALHRNTVLTMDEMRKALGGVSRSTACRALAQISYLTSYNHNGRYYTLDQKSRYDELGLWSYRGIRFSRYGNLTDTVRALVQRSEEGCTQPELEELLGVRVQNTLQALLERGELVRERFDRVFVYFDSDEEVQGNQKRQRQKLIGRRRRESEGVDPEVIIDILLILIRHPGTDEAGVAQRLKGRSPPVDMETARWVFDRYELGQKRGLSGS